MRQWGELEGEGPQKMLRPLWGRDPEPVLKGRLGQIWACSLLFPRVPHPSLNNEQIIGSAHWYTIEVEGKMLATKLRLQI